MLLAACSGDDGIDMNQLLGNWETSEFMYKLEKVRTGEVLTDTVYPELSRWSFYENFTGKYSVRDKYSTSTENFKYSPEDRTISFGMNVLTIDRISSTTMRISQVHESFMEKYEANVRITTIWELKKIDEQSQ